MDVLQALINAAQMFVERGFSADDFLVWQQLSFLTILGLLGPLHYYTKQFGQFTEKPSTRSLLAGEGLLEATKGEITRGSVNTLADGKLEPTKTGTSYTPWLARPKQWYSLESLRESLLHPKRPVLAAQFDEPERKR